MGQSVQVDGATAYQISIPTCCNCAKRPGELDRPIQVIHQGLPEADPPPGGNGATVLAYSSKAVSPKREAGPQVSAEPTAEPEPAPVPETTQLQASPSPSAPSNGVPPPLQQQVVAAAAPVLAPSGSPAVLPSVPERAPLTAAPPLLQANATPAAAPLQNGDPFTTLDTLPSEPFATLEYEEATKRQKSTAKQLVKDFVKTMVRGRQLYAMLPTGQARACFCALNRGLDKLQIRAQEKDRHGRTVPLQNIAEIVVGSDRSASAATAGLETPLDDLCVTLVLESDECITFRLEDVESRDKLAACLTMFSGQARTAKRGS